MDLCESKLVGKPACRHFRSHSDREVAFRVRKRAGVPFSSPYLPPKAGVQATSHYHPSHNTREGTGGWAASDCARPASTLSTLARNNEVLSARCASTKGSPATPPLFPECATREHRRDRRHA